MNRRQMFTGLPAVVAGTAGTIAAIKSAAAEPATIVTDEALIDSPMTMQQILHLPSPAVQMMPYRDMLIVACQNGEVMAVQYDHERAYMRGARMYETG